MSLVPWALGRKTLTQACRLVAATTGTSAAVLAVAVLAGPPGIAAAATQAHSATLAVSATGRDATTAKPRATVTNPSALVNPFIGTTNSGDTFPGADAPLGMVQWSPDTSPNRDDGGGYEYNDSAITGFSLTHLSGPGCGAEGDVPVLPTTGAINTGATDSFSHSNESAQAGYYSVTTSNGVKTELTATTRTGMARFTFPSTTQANLIFKLNDSANGDSATSFNVVSSTEVSGSVTSGHFCGAGNTYTLYFDMQFDQPFSTNGTFTPLGLHPRAKHLSVRATGRGDVTSPVSRRTPEQRDHPSYHGGLPKGQTTGVKLAGPNGSYVTFNTTSNQVVQAKVGVSYVSIANAKQNLTTENPNFNFPATESATQSAWNSLLGRIQISGGTSNQQVEFYTALYHALLHPNVNSDVNGQYIGVDGQVHTVDSGHSAEYTNFSGWDIYRSQAQLEAMLDPAAASDTAQSMVDDYAQGGMLPKWMENNGESYVMVGDPADPILADYYAFGATNFNTATALTDMVNEATNTNNIRPGLNYLESIGYEPTDGSYGCCNFYGPTSTTLEYNTADFALSAFAGALGNTSDQNTFQNRAQDWQNVFNPATGFMEGRNFNGSWESGFNAQSGSDGNFVEATPYIYTGMVPFNIAGLTSAMGGTSKMISYLNTVLSSFTGANGFAWMGNEPSIELPWEYDYVGEPYQTQNVVRKVQDQIWTNSPNGLGDGNDDLGTMSAWFVWSALGMYPETPGTANLALGSPMFTQAVVTLGNGSTLTINGNGAADNAPYVQSATWNGVAWNNAYAPTTAVTSGGTLTFTLGTSANTSWASGATAAPPSYGGPSGVYNNTGIENDGSTGASFDSGGNAYSAQALSSAGATPGSTVTANGIHFTWPNVAVGTPDNFRANGQTVTVSGSGSISFLGSSTNGPSSGTATIKFTDGSTMSDTLSFSDWTLNGGSASVESGNSLAITTAYRDNSTGGKETVKTDVFATTPLALPAGKTIASVTLPASANQGQLHVFAIATSTSGGGSAAFNNIGIENDGTSADSFDSSGNAYSAQAISAAGVTPGSTVSVNGINFTWPNVAVSTADNWVASGQTVALSGSGSISFLGSSTNGPSSGTATITFTDGSTMSVSLSFSDWTLNGGSASVESGNSIAINTPYRDTSAGTKETINTDVFATTPVSLPSGKTVASVTLPATVNQGLLHVFAIATSSGGSTKARNPSGRAHPGTPSRTATKPSP
ncbi:MAG TPA: lectin [Streptosporangiaceae bacterium]|nr:lectin [Streptosporangiaceae bacterium]